jgi:hypothetical protein
MHSKQETKTRPVQPLQDECCCSASEPQWEKTRSTTIFTISNLNYMIY